MVPSLVKLQSNREKTLEIIFLATRLALFILVFTLTPILFFGEQFFQLWVGQEFARDSQILLLCLAHHLLINTQHSVISIWLTSIKEMDELTSFYIKVNVFNLILSVALGWIYGAYGIAIATTIAFLVFEGNFLHLCFKKLEFSWKKWIVEVLKPVTIFTIVLWGCGFYFRNYIFLQNPAHDIGLIALYLVVCAITRLSLDGISQLKRIRG